MPACHSTEHADQAIRWPSSACRLDVQPPPERHLAPPPHLPIPCPSLINDQVRRERIVDLLNAGYINRGEAALHLRRHTVHAGCVAHHGKGWYDTVGTSFLPQCLQSCAEQTKQSDTIK